MRRAYPFRGCIRVRIGVSATRTVHERLQRQYFELAQGDKGGTDRRHMYIQA